MWQNSYKVNSGSSNEAEEVPQIVVNGYSFAERCQRLGKAIEWIKREVSLMKADDEQLTREFHEMEELTTELLPELISDRQRSSTLPLSNRVSQTSVGSTGVGNGHVELEKPQSSPRLKRPISEYKKKAFPLYVSQSTTNLHVNFDEGPSKDSTLKSSVSLLQLNSSNRNDRRVSADSGLPSDDTEADGLNFDLSFSTDVFAALANMHGISMTNNNPASTTV